MRNKNAATHPGLPKVDVRQVLQVYQSVSPTPGQQHAIEAAPRQIELAHVGARFLDCLGTEIGLCPVQNVNLKVLERCDDCFVGMRAVAVVLNTDIDDVLHALVFTKPRERRSVSHLYPMPGAERYQTMVRPRLSRTNHLKSFTMSFRPLPRSPSRSGRASVGLITRGPTATNRSAVSKSSCL